MQSSYRGRPAAPKSHHSKRMVTAKDRQHKGKETRSEKRDEQGRTKKLQRWQEEHTGRTKLATSCVIHGGVFRKQLNSNTYNYEALAVS